MNIALQLNLIMIANQLSRELQSQNFDIREFLLAHFVQANFEINYKKIASSLPAILQLQHQTCEDIATSVDNNLDDYMQISVQLGALQHNLDDLTTKFNRIEQTISLTKDNLEQTIYQVNVIVQNLKLIQTLESHMKKLRRLLHALRQYSPATDDYLLLENSDLIMKVRKLYQEVDKSPHCRQICQQYDICTTVNHLYDQQTNLLEQEFVICLQQSSFNVDRFAILIKSFNMLGLFKTPERLVVQFILKPQIDSGYARLVQNKHMLLKDSTDLQVFLQSILDIYHQHTLLARFESETFSFRVILMELVYIYLSQKDCSSVYSLGVLDLFQSNFIKIQQLKATMEVTFDRGSEVEKRFLEKWNLQTYFQMRQVQIVKGFENDLKIATQSQELRLAETLQQYLELCFSENVFLKQLNTKFLKFAVQLINRFISVVKECQFKEADYCLVLNSVGQVQFPVQFPEALAVIQAQKMIQLAHSLSERAIVPVVNECIYNLEPFSGIPAKYRMTNREMPTQPSNFCSNVFRPLMGFLQKIETESVKQIISEEVCAKTMERFLAIKKSALETCDKNEELMQKMGVKKNDALDNQKIRTQYGLDEAELRQIIQSKFLEN